MPDERGGPGPWLALALTGLAALGGFYLVFFREQASPASTGSPFRRSPAAPPPAVAGPAPEQDSPASGLSLVERGDLRGSPALAAAQGAPPARTAAPRGSGAPAASMSATAQKLWQLRPRFEAMNRKFMARYPAVARYENEWMADPGLRKLRDDFMLGDHDPVKFVKGAAASKTFNGLIGKYARQPGMQAFAKEAMANVPADLLATMNDYLNKDGAVADLANRLVGALGLPPMIGGKMDPNAIMQSAMKNAQPRPGR